MSFKAFSSGLVLLILAHSFTFAQSSGEMIHNKPHIKSQPLNNFVQLLGSNNQSTNNDQFDGVLYAEIGSITDLDTSKSIEYQWYANGNLMPGETNVALRGMRWSNTYFGNSFHVDVTYTPIGSSDRITLSSDSMKWGNFYFKWGAEPGNGYQGTSNSEGIRDIIVMPDYQGNNPKALSSYMQYDSGVSEPGNEADRHSIKTVHQDDVGVPARSGEYLVEFSAKEISNRTELGTGDTHHWFYEGEDIYFAFSLYLPSEEWDRVTNISTIITQLRQFGMYDGPNFGLRLSNEGDYRLIMESMLFEEGEYPYIATLGPDQWFDIKIHSKQSKEADGEVNIWIDNQLVWSYNGPTMYYSDDAGYISFGMYTEILDDRIFYIDEIEQTDHLYRVNSLEEWSQLSPSGDTTAPNFTSASTSTDGTKVILTYNETLSSTTAAASDFTLVVDGSVATISSVATSGSTVELTLDSPITYGQTVTVAYTDPTSSNDTNATQDLLGNDAGNLSSTAVTNEVREITGLPSVRLLGSTEDPSSMEYGWRAEETGGRVKVDLTSLFDLDQNFPVTYVWYVDEAVINGASSQELVTTGYAEITGESNIRVVVNYTNTIGENIQVESPEFNYNHWRIRSGAENETIVGDNPTPFWETYSYNNDSSNKDENGEMLTDSDIHSIEPILGSSVGISPVEGDYIIRVHADSRNYGSSEPKSYSKRSELGNRDWNTRIRKDSEVFYSTHFYLPSEYWNNETEYSIIFMQQKQYVGGEPNFALRISNLGDYKMYVQSKFHLPLPQHNAYEIATLNPDSWHKLNVYLKPAFNGNGLMNIYLDGQLIYEYAGTNLRNESAYDPNEHDTFLKLGMYTEIRDERVIYLDNVEMSNHIDTELENWVSLNNPPTAEDTTAPNFTSASTSTDGTKVILTYNETLSSTTAAASDFTLVVDGSVATISSVATSGSTVELTLDSPITYGQTVTVAYTDPTSSNDTNATQDLLGNDAGNLSSTAVTNEVREITGLPSVRLLGSTEDPSSMEYGWRAEETGGRVKVDLTSLFDLDQNFPVTYVWYVDEAVINGASSQELVTTGYAEITGESNIRVVVNYTNTIGENIQVESPEFNYNHWRIRSGAENETIVGDNPTPFWETYSYNNDSSNKDENGEMLTDSDIHSISPILGDSIGVSPIEGEYIIRIHADGSNYGSDEPNSFSKRAELGNRDWNNRIRKGSEVFYSTYFYLPSDYWDNVTKYSIVFFQHKQYVGGSPNFEIRLSNNGDYGMYIRSEYHLEDCTKSEACQIATMLPNTWHKLTTQSPIKCEGLLEGCNNCSISSIPAY